MELDTSARWHHKIRMSNLSTSLQARKCLQCRNVPGIRRPARSTTAARACRPGSCGDVRSDKKIIVELSAVRATVVVRVRAELTVAAVGSRSPEEHRQGCHHPRQRRIDAVEVEHAVLPMGIGKGVRVCRDKPDWNWE